MSHKQVTVVTCDKCGATSDRFSGDWTHLTQPSRSFCPKCKPKSSVVNCPYTEEYFLRGKKSKLSLYENYRWLPKLTVSMVQAIINFLDIDRRDPVLDFGCARGYVVRAFRELGYQAWGTDVSEWAVRNCDESVKGYIQWTPNSPPFLDKEFSWIIAKDVLEHVSDLATIVSDIMRAAGVGVFAVIPLSAADGAPYVVPEYEADVTHIHRLTLASWVALFARPGWAVDARYRLPGVKDNYAQHETGNGFITARRLMVK